MRNFLKITSFFLILILVLVSCSSKNKTIMSFTESEIGILKAKQLLMNDQKALDNYVSEIYKTYKGNLEENRIIFSLNEDLKVIIGWSKIGNKIATINYFISSSEIIDDNLTCANAC